ncbi:LTA synthase family protein [Pseudoalteromonas piscicida]|uniref:Sulfatase N-terminal domain-containing protein n=1 Tax=Pseudoalteromonas piscicida TaxID=43662 RepID=A0A2A5JR01_PSEO7|nr:LTA synthase family protein [Pseudoalteromonas piscicida]PCK31855.1 hypothetical protein CEX98_10175 [Pseudoalteromonas piscicida]
MNHKTYLTPYAKPFIAFFLTLLIILTMSRIGLSVWMCHRMTDMNLLAVIVSGLRVDLSSIAYLAIPLLLAMSIHFVMPPPAKRLFSFLIVAYITICLTSVLLLEAATPAFIQQYDVRPNRLFIEYLIYPKAVFSMLLSGHLGVVIFTLLLCLLAVITTLKYFPRIGNEIPSKRSMTISTVCSLICLALLARGTLGHRPLNPATVYFSQDALINSLLLNSAYSVAFAAKNMGSEKSASALYGTLSNQKVIDTVREASFKHEFISEQIPTLATNQAYHQGQKKNLVIILEESLGARFVGALGGKNLTPELDKLYQEGWGLKNLYATGTRSVRGIEAVVSGFLPSPSRSVVKLSKSQQQFYTLADVLSRENYTTQFIYGGESHFDNMKSFFLGNGFQDIVDFDDIENPAFVASWGVSDEDLFNQADKELTKLSKEEKPFFSLIFTSSNHDPFEIPDGKVALSKNHQSDRPERDLAIKYADYALGEFINKAKQSRYWQNTIFLVVADHDVRVYGSEPVPIKSFHIPAVILNSSFNHKQDQRLVSQIDLPVTLLSLIGIEQPTPMLGFDLTKHYPVERAMMQYYDNFAYIENQQAAILMPGHKVSYWEYNVESKLQSPLKAAKDSAQLRDKALSHVLFSNLAYQEQLYRLKD